VTPETEDALKKLGVRIIIAAPFVGFAFYYWATATGGWSAAPGLILSSALLILAAIIVGPALAELFSTSSGNLFYPQTYNKKPAPRYSVGEALVRQGRYHAAIDFYKELASDYPEEAEPYIQLMNIAFAYLGENELGESFYREGVSRLKSPKAINKLNIMYQGLRTQTGQAAKKWGDGPESC
jgi:tetratricopeptide (TPR) repeat protein